MSGSYYGLIVKARWIDEAEEKARKIINNVIVGAEGFYENGSDHYFDEVQEHEGIWDGANADDPHDRSFIKTAKVTSDSGKKLINLFLFHSGEYTRSDGVKIIIHSNGDSIYLDEKGDPIEPNDSRLLDQDYFIVPVRLHY
jgi:hypothetical protein